MDLFEQLEQIDTLIGEAEEKRKQETLFNPQKGTAMDFIVHDMDWMETELERAQKAEEQKLKPLGAGFGPWSW